MTFSLFSLVTICVVFFGIGWGNAAMGPLLASFAANAGLPLSQAGFIFTVGFAGGVIANLTGGTLSDRLGRGWVLFASLLFACVGGIGVTLAHSLPLLVAFMVLCGAGGSAVILSASALVSELFVRRGVAAMNLTTLFFGIGAFTGPALVSLSFSLWKTGMPSMWLSCAIGLSVAVPLVLAVIRRMGTTARPAERSEALGANPAASPGAQPPFEGQPSVRSASFLLSPLLWVFGAILLFDVGTEQTILAWTTVYMNHSTTLSVEDAALVVSGFWVTFTLGRLLAAGVGSRWSSNGLLLLSLVTGAAGILLINLGTGRVVPSILGFLLTGLGFGPLFPTVVALVGRGFGKNAGAAMGITMTFGSAGGMFMVWFEGILIAGSGPAGGVRLYAVTLLAIMLLAFGARLLMRRSDLRSVSPR